jgi:hypothetical protein
MRNKLTDSFLCIAEGEVKLLGSLHTFEGLLDIGDKRLVQLDWSGVNASSLGNRYHGELLRKIGLQAKIRYGKALYKMT